MDPFNCLIIASFGMALYHAAFVGRMLILNRRQRDEDDDKILAILTVAPGYGYELIRRAELRGVADFPGTVRLYASLRRLEARGLIESFEGDPDRDGQPRVWYRRKKYGRS